MKYTIKNISKYIIASLLFICSITLLNSCNKDTTGADINLSYQMLSDKTWYLDYSITGTTQKTYIGQTTYLINFLKDKTMKDSDGLTGVYSIGKSGNTLQINVQGKTSNNNDAVFVYNIEYIGSNNLVLTYTLTNATVPTKLYFTTK